MLTAHNCDDEPEPSGQSPRTHNSAAHSGGRSDGSSTTPRAGISPVERACSAVAPVPPRPATVPLRPALITTNEVEADGHRCIWNQTFRFNVPAASGGAQSACAAMALLRIDLHARVHGRGALVRVASARVSLAELLASSSGDMRFVELRRLSLEQLADENRDLARPLPRRSPSRRLLMPSTSELPIIPYHGRGSDGNDGACGGAGAVPAPACAVTALHTAMPETVNVGVAAAHNPKAIAAIEASWDIETSNAATPMRAYRSRS